MTAVRRIDMDHLKTLAFGLVLNQGLELPKSPFVKTGSHFLSCSDPRSYMGQIFQNNQSCFLLNSLLDNFFAHLVVDMLHTASFFARDLLQQLFRRLSTVGLKSLPFGKKFSSFVTDLASAIQVSSAGCCQHILSQVNTHYFSLFRFWWIGKLQHEVKIPSAFSADEFSFRWSSLRKIAFLESAHSHGNANAPLKGIQRKNVFLYRIRSMIEMDAPVFSELNDWNGFIFSNCFGFISLANGKDGIADHLRAQGRGFSDFVIDQVVQCDSIPAPLFDNTGNNLITDQVIFSLELPQKLLVFLSSLKKYADGPFHRAVNIIKCYFNLNYLRRAALPSTPEGAGIRAVI